MKLHYDRAADVLHIRLSEKKIAMTEAIAEGVNLDYDGARELVGIEILFVSRRLRGEAAEAVAFELLLGPPH